MIRDSISIMIETIENIQKFTTRGDIHCLISRLLDRASHAHQIQAYNAVRIHDEDDCIFIDGFWGSMRISDINHSIIAIATISVR